MAASFSQQLAFTVNRNPKYENISSNWNFRKQSQGKTKYFLVFDNNKAGASITFLFNYAKKDGFSFKAITTYCMLVAQITTTQCTLILVNTTEKQVQLEAGHKLF